MNYESLSAIDLEDALSEIDDLVDEQLEDISIIEDEWDRAYDDYPKESEEVERAKFIRELPWGGVCIIEEPLTCCNELPEPIDHTEEFNKVVEDPIGDIIELDIKPYLYEIDELDRRKYDEDNWELNENNNTRDNTRLKEITDDTRCVGSLK